MRFQIALAVLAALTAGAAPLGPVASVARELQAKAAAYASGTITMDPGLPGRLEALEKALEAFGQALPAGDARRPVADSLSKRSSLMRARAASAPKATALRAPATGEHAERFWKALGPDLAALAAAAAELEGAASAGAPAVAALSSRAASETAAAAAAAHGAAAAELARRLAGGDVFAPSAVELPPLSPSAAPLARGAHDDRVGGAQLSLNALRKASGVREIAVDDAYGRVTEAAIARFQREHAKAYGLKPTGRLDAATELALRREYEASRERSERFTQRGDENLGVEMLQRRLNEVGGFRFLTPDGRFGPRTEDAVHAFQRTHHLKVGGMDESTWNALIAEEPASEPRRSVAAPGTPAPLGPLGATWPSRRIPADLAGRVLAAANKHGLEPALFHSLVWAEGGRLGDRSSNIARGPAQITQSAAAAECKDLGWAAVRSQDAANLECGARILSRRGREYLGDGADPMIAASLYNTKMKHWKKIAERRMVPAFPETVSYVTRISRYYCQITGRRLLEPKRHLDPRMNALSRRVDREMSDEIAGEGQTLRPGCSPTY